MQVSSRKLTSKQRKKALALLLPKVQVIKKQADLNKLFNLLLTKEEKEAILKRLIIGDMLEKKIKYRDIGKALSVSQLTISKVRDILEARGYGRNPGRKRVYSYPKRKEKPLLGYYKGVPSII